MGSYVPGVKIKVVPISGESEMSAFANSKKYELICLYVTKTEEGEKINIGYPTVASYNQALGNMFGYTKKNGKYFVSGDFPEFNDRAVYLITVTDSLTVDSYSQLNIPSYKKEDLLEFLKKQEDEVQIKRAN